MGGRDQPEVECNPRSDLPYVLKRRRGSVLVATSPEGEKAAEGSAGGEAAAKQEESKAAGKAEKVTFSGPIYQPVWLDHIVKLDLSNVILFNCLGRRPRHATSPLLGLI